MSSGNFEACIEVVRPHEGGYVNDKRDPGGETNYGISKRAYPKVDIKGLTWRAAKAIYKRDGWHAIKGDQLPAGVDLVILDLAINSGVSRGAKFLQAAVGVTADGQIGAMTLAAVAKRDPRALIQHVSAKRMGFLQSLRIWKTYSKGWSRRVTGVEIEALKMAGAKSADFKVAAASAQGEVRKTTVKATSVTASPLAGSLTGVPDYTLWIVAAVALAVLVGLILQRHNQAARAAALSKEV